MALTSALLVLLALVHDCAALTLTPNKALALRTPVAAAGTRALAAVRMEEEEAPAPPPPPPAYVPTDAEVSEFMRTLPALKGAAETVKEKRARATQLLKEQYDPAAIAKV